MRTTKFEIGKTYKTHGGWDAQVVWIRNSSVEGAMNVFAVHKAGTDEESYPICHNAETGKAFAIFAVAEAPTYAASHPADLIAP